MIVEDDDLLTELEKETLEEEGFHVEIARDGVEALEKIKRDRHYDVIISGFEMPRMKGNAFYREVAVISQDLADRIIFASANINSFIKSTGNRFIAKPFSPGHFVEAVNELVKSKSS